MKSLSYRLLASGITHGSDQESNISLPLLKLVITIENYFLSQMKFEDTDGVSPLHIAANAGHTDVARELLK